jgi:hypothetical protein
MILDHRIPWVLLIADIDCAHCFSWSSQLVMTKVIHPNPNEPQPKFSDAPADSLWNRLGPFEGTWLQWLQPCWVCLLGSILYPTFVASSVGTCWYDLLIHVVIFCFPKKVYFIRGVFTPWIPMISGALHELMDLRNLSASRGPRSWHHLQAGHRCFFRPAEAPPLRKKAMSKLEKPSGAQRNRTNPYAVQWLSSDSLILSYII